MKRLDGLFVSMCDELNDNFEMKEKDKENLGFYLAQVREGIKKINNLIYKYNGDAFVIENFLYEKNYLIEALELMAHDTGEFAAIEDDFIDAIEENPELYKSFAKYILYWARMKELEDEFDECISHLRGSDVVETPTFREVKFNMLEKIIQSEIGKVVSDGE